MLRGSGHLSDSVAGVNYSISLDEGYLYRELLSIAFELADRDDPRSAVLCLKGMSDDCARIFLSCLSDAEFFTDYKPLLKLAQNYLKSANKQLAQSAAAFLCFCCGEDGKKRIKSVLKGSEVTHKELVKGMVTTIKEGLEWEDERKQGV
jgi:hypothetical protein